MAVQSNRIQLRAVISHISTTPLLQNVASILGNPGFCFSCRTSSRSRSTTCLCSLSIWQGCTCTPLGYFGTGGQKLCWGIGIGLGRRTFGTTFLDFFPRPHMFWSRVIGAATGKLKFTIICKFVFVQRAVYWIQHDMSSVQLVQLHLKLQVLLATTSM